MPGSSAEKRVVVESTPTTLALRVADRFLTRVRARTATAGWLTSP